MIFPLKGAEGQTGSPTGEACVVRSLAVGTDDDPSGINVHGGKIASKCYLENEPLDACFANEQ